MEFCSLSVEDKLEVLVALVDRILNSYSVADHMEKKIVESKAAWRHRIKVFGCVFFKFRCLCYCNGETFGSFGISVASSFAV